MRRHEGWLPVQHRWYKGPGKLIGHLATGSATIWLTLVMATSPVGGELTPPPGLFQEQAFALPALDGSGAELAFTASRPCRIRLVAQWSGAAPELSLQLAGPGRTEPYARREGRSRLALDYAVTADDLRLGRDWIARVVNHSRRGPANGVLRVIVAPALAFDYDFLGDYPRDREPGWGDECQGIAHDDANWFISQRFYLWKFPFAEDLNADRPRPDPAAGILMTRIPRDFSDSHYDHFGDGDVRDGRLYIPLEDSSDGGNFARLLVFDTADLRFIASGELSGERHAPWCAVSPHNGLLYTSGFSFVWTLRAFRHEIASRALRLELDHELELRDGYGEPVRFDRVQGGAFSAATGLFYLVNDEGTGDSGGIFVFDGRTGVQLGRIWIDYRRGWGQELEGITVCDRDDRRAPSVGGQVHTVMISNATATTDLWIKHHRVPLEKVIRMKRPEMQVRPLQGRGSGR